MLPHIHTPRDTRRHLIIIFVSSQSDNYKISFSLLRKTPPKQPQQMSSLLLVPSLYTSWTVIYKQDQPISTLNGSRSFPPEQMWINDLNTVNADTEMNLHLLCRHRNIVLRTGLTCSRTNHKGLITPPAASWFDLWPQTVVASAGESSRIQTPAESRAECLERLLRLHCFWDVTSQGVAEQIGMRAVLCVSRLGRCAVNHLLIILQRGGKATTSIASIRLFRSHYIIFTYRRPKQSYLSVSAPRPAAVAPHALWETLNQPQNWATMFGYSSGCKFAWNQLMVIAISDLLSHSLGVSVMLLHARV